MTLAEVRRRAHVIARPTTDNELWWLVRYLWGIEIPRVQVCDNHVAPFSAFADSYFARYPVTVWKASRGLAGKTFTLAHLSLTEISVLGARVSFLGGSLDQSKLGHEYTKGAWDTNGAPADLLASDPTHRETTLNNGGHISVLAASTKSARGPHPERLRLDEADEMDQFVFESALGQPIGTPGIPSQTTISSTHHYPNKTFSYILEELAPEKGWPIYEWCYRESRATNPGGWLADDEIVSTKGRIPQHMWDVEYELQEPNVEGRAVDFEAIEEAFDPALGVFEGAEGELIVIEEPIDGAIYYTGVDWAKEQDWTVIATFRIREDGVWLCVAWQRLGRRRWPVMVEAYEDRLSDYTPGVDDVRRQLTTAHDSTGVGDVIDDYLEFTKGGYTPDGIVMAGQRRAGLFSDYTAAIEDGAILYPRIRFAYDEHRYTTVADLYGSGRANHPPDSFVAGAMAWACRSTQAGIVAAPETAAATSKWRGR